MKIDVKILGDGGGSVLRGVARLRRELLYSGKPPASVSKERGNQKKKICV